MRDCEFDPYDEDPDESYHFKRVCRACGYVFWSLHCPHDGVQSACPNCGIRQA